MICLLAFDLSQAYVVPPVPFSYSISSNIMQDSSRLDMSPMPYVPYYPDKARKDYMWLDIYNALGRERTLFVGRFLDEESCNQLIASLVWLSSQDDKKPITLYFNVPGSIIKPAFAVYDVMRRMTCPLRTINAGLTCGMGALLCAVGTPGERYALPNSRFLVGRTGMEDAFQGQAVDMAKAVMEVQKDNIKFETELARLIGQPLDKLKTDLNRDFYLTAAEAAAYGVVDKVMLPHKPVKMQQNRGSDNQVINFGHFAEAHKVKAGPDDIIAKTPNDPNFDKYTAEELAKLGYDGSAGQRKKKKKGLDPNRGAANRFAGSRLKPPVINRDDDDEDDGASGKDYNKGRDKFKNAGF